MEKMDNYKLRIKSVISNYGEVFFRNSNIVGVGRGNKVINGKMTNKPTLLILVKKKVTSNLLNQSEIIINKQ